MLLFNRCGVLSQQQNTSIPSTPSSSFHSTLLLSKAKQQIQPNLRNAVRSHSNSLIPYPIINTTTPSHSKLASLTRITPANKSQLILKYITRTYTDEVKSPPARQPRPPKVVIEKIPNLTELDPAIAQRQKEAEEDPLKHYRLLNEGNFPSLDPNYKPHPQRMKEEAFAIIHVCGRQYKVVPGDVILVMRIIGAHVGQEIAFTKILMIGTKNWTALGTPLLPAAEVHAAVEEQTLSSKQYVFKKKRRKGYRRTRGVRDPITTLRIRDIVFDSNSYFDQATQSQPAIDSPSSTPSNPATTNS